MIVVDTNIITYLHLPTAYTQFAEQLLFLESEWAAPYLWRSEFRSVLALYMRKGLMTYESALQAQRQAESLIRHHEYSLSSFDILSVINNSTCSAYDCEFVALAQKLHKKLVTEDKKILKEFPETALSLKQALLLFT